ncbi:MAG: hypothetical protein K6E29_05810 [Cyanobacteria bacterium RUI128]|nr:hypothetical protein [Cyanobacteria bacterium RUI128]
MLVNFSGINNGYIYNNQPRFINFCGTREPVSDRFEKSGEPIELGIFNPFSDKFMHKKERIDLEQPCRFEIKDTKDKYHPLVVDYDPSRTGIIRNRRNGLPVVVNILKLECPYYDNQTAYAFMSKDLKQQYGYVSLCIPMIDDKNSGGLLKDYPEYGITGKRAIVSYLRNFDEDNVCGVGKLADRLGVQYCLENGFEPNIMSYADEYSHVAHFKRGKRFIPPEEGSEDYKFLKDQYGITDPNEILQYLIQDAEWNGTDVDLTGWGYLMMYLPKDMIDKYR